MLTANDARRIAIEVVSAAIQEARKPPYKIRCEVEIERRDAIDWVLCADRSNTWIEAAGLDPEAVRARVAPRLRAE